ncbi:hypothetical protein [Waltera sp.]|jgi:hypothetical protein|uniref:hypothetical protein n=1 Tax=Waltera sp. TaxID=2815806 RepID=UPI003AF02726
MKNKHGNRSLPANRNYKDTIFRWLFSDKNNLLSLYNAIAGAHYQNPEALNIVTLENAVYMGMKNDLAFVLETGLYLYEHQSTYNPNIPLRDLFYIASEYQSLINQRPLYSSTLQTIPTPKFLVFYNGTDENIPDRLELRLSDAYENYSENPDLELKVTMLNINSDHNFELLKNCHVLWEYSQYVTRVRKYATMMSLNDAVNLAITECIQEGILTEFLSHNRAEVLKVSIFEYDKEKEEKLIRKAEFDYGKAMGLADGVISLLEEKGRLSEDQINSIRRETRPEKQTEWFKLAIKVDTIDEFFKKANIKRQ